MACAGQMKFMSNGEIKVVEAKDSLLPEELGPHPMPGWTIEDISGGSFDYPAVRMTVLRRTTHG